MNRVQTKKDDFEFELTDECYDDLVIDVAINLLNHILDKNEIIQYGELANMLSSPINPRNLDRPLGCISDACKENGLPLLSVMVVNKETLMPGSGFFNYFYPHLKRTQWEEKFIEEYKKVQAFKNWDKVLDAFCGNS